MRIVLCALVFSLLAPAARGDDHPLAALAARAADEVARIAAGRPVQIDVPADRTGLPGVAADLRSLLEGRLRGRVAIAATGPRLRLSSVFDRSATRLRLAARISEEPGGALVDVVAVSAEADPDLVALLALPPPPAGPSVTVVSRSESVAVPGPVLDLAFVDDDRVLVLLADAVALFRRDRAALALLDRRPLPRTSAVRAPAGILAVVPGEAAGWVAANQAEGAVLFSIDGDRLVETQRAAALPWPGAPQGARFRPGTNLLEVAVPGLGPGPFLRVGRGETAWAIRNDGRLGVARAGWTEARVGAAAATLWAGVVMTSSPAPPGMEDALVVHVLGSGSAKPEAALTVPMEGSVTALAARSRGGTARVAAAVTAGGRHRIALMELARARP